MKPSDPRDRALSTDADTYSDAAYQSRAAPTPADTYPDRDQRSAPACAPLAFGTLSADAASVALYAPPPCMPPAPAAGGGARSGTPGGVHAGGMRTACLDELPESTPAPVTDPTEAVMLATYLRLVQETQGNEAAAMAAASSAAVTGSPTPQLAAAAAVTSRPSSRPASRPTSAGGGGAMGAAQQHARGPEAGGGEGGAARGVGEVVSSMLGFIRDRKLATNNPPQRRTSLGGESSSSTASSGSKSSMKIWIQPSGEPVTDRCCSVLPRRWQLVFPFALCGFAAVAAFGGLVFRKSLGQRLRPFYPCTLSGARKLLPLLLPLPL